jgi:hypothetical protein
MLNAESGVIAASLEQRVQLLVGRLPIEYHGEHVDSHARPPPFKLRGRRHRSVSVVAGETVDLLRVGTRIPRGRPHSTFCVAGPASHFAPTMTAVDLADEKAALLSMAKRIGDLLLRVATRADHV